MSANGGPRLCRSPSPSCASRSNYRKVGHQTIDGGSFTAPPGRIYGPDGRWFAEGRGVEPDIPVVDHPGEMARGGDPQLDAAIAEVLRLIEENPPTLPTTPAFERRVPRRGGR